MFANVKEKLNIPVLVVGIVITMFFVATTVFTYGISNSNRIQNVAEEKLGWIEQTLQRYVSIADTVEMTVIENDGTIRDFDIYARMISKRDSDIKRIHLAPDGKTRYVYPDVSNSSSIMVDLFKDPLRSDYAKKAKDTGEPVIAGPLTLKTGGTGLIVFKPVYVRDTSEFWGLIVLVVDQDAFLQDIDEKGLAAHSMDYRIWHGAPSDDGVLVSSNSQNLNDPKTVSRTIYGDDWFIEAALQADPLVVLRRALSTICLLVITVLVSMTVASREQLKFQSRLLKARNKELEIDSNVDVLTGLLNRRGGEKALSKAQEKLISGGGTATLLALDVDNFKMVNDVYGHEAGDILLKIFANDIKRSFGSKAVYVRNGGDEFMIYIPDKGVEDLEADILRFADRERRFTYGDKIVTFSVSVGYAQYSGPEVSLPELSAHADTALYAVKLNNNICCAEYEPSMEHASRIQLGFNLKDIAKGMPGAMLVYRDDETEEILFANAGLIELFECVDWEDFKQSIGSSFRDIPVSEDLERVESSIYEQIGDEDEGLDQVEYKIRTAKGNILDVWDFGRLVNSDYYGKIFYVFLAPKGEPSAIDPRFL